jgi:hypothetical protein
MISAEAQAVFVEGIHEFKAPYTWKISGKHGTMYAIVDRSACGISRGAQPSVESPRLLECQLSTATKNVSLFGFNATEPWGAWSARDGAEIVFPEFVQGHVKVSCKGFVPAETAPAAVVFRIGDGTITYTMSDTLTEYVGECDVRVPVDRMTIFSGVFQPNPWDRPLGVGIMEVKIESVIARTDDERVTYGQNGDTPR